MPRASAVVTAAELSVLNFLWENGPSVVRVISSTLYQENTPAYHATVNSLLDQLEKKGYVSRDRSGYAHQFEAAVKRDELIGTELQQIADSHFGGALAPMLMPLVEKINLSKRDRDAIQKIMDKSR